MIRNSILRTRLAVVTAAVWWCSPVAAITIFYEEELSNVVSAQGPIESEVTGADMDIRTVNTAAALFVNYLNPGTFAADAWSATGPDSGEGSDGGIALSLAGSTFDEPWRLESTGSVGPLAVSLFNGDDAQPPPSGLKRLVVFDRFGTMDDAGTKNSGLGGDLEVVEASGDWDAIEVTYKDPVRIGTGPAQGDLFAGLRIRFGTVGAAGEFVGGVEFKAGDSLVFHQDTDVIIDQLKRKTTTPTLKVKDAVAVGMPLPLDIVSVEVLVDGIDPATGAPGPVPLQVFGLTLNKAQTAPGEEIGFRGSASVSGAGDSATFTFTPLTTTGGENFFEVLVDILGVNGTDAGLEAVILHELNLVGQEFFEAWVDVSSTSGVTRYRSRFETTAGGEFFDVSVGDPGSAFPVTFGIRGESGFQVLMSAIHTPVSVSAPASLLLMLLGLPILGARARGLVPSRFVALGKDCVNEEPRRRAGSACRPR